MARNEKGEALERELGTSYQVNADGSVTFEGTPTDEEREAAYAAAAEAAKERTEAQEAELAKAGEEAAAVTAAHLSGQSPDQVTTDQPLEREGAAQPLPRELGTEL